MVKNKLFKDSGFSIIFEGETLPNKAYCIDLLGMHGSLSGISELSSHWLWQFTICKDRERSDKSETILTVAYEVLSLIKTKRIHLIHHLQEHNPEIHETDIEDWIRTLETIQALAETNNTCSWYGIDY